MDSEQLFNWYATLLIHLSAWTRSNLSWLRLIASNCIAFSRKRPCHYNRWLMWGTVMEHRVNTQVIKSCSVKPTWNRQITCIHLQQLSVGSATCTQFTRIYFRITHSSESSVDSGSVALAIQTKFPSQIIMPNESSLRMRCATKIKAIPLRSDRWSIESS